MKQTQAVIHELDGLVIDSEPVHQRAFETVIAQRGINYKLTIVEFASNFVGFPTRENAKWLVEHFDLDD